MGNDFEEFGFLDILTIFSVMLQIKGYQSDIRQVSNDDLMKELVKQDREYLGKILENQKLILSKLAELG
ncbi:MAG: hypothetical protein J6D28_02695 [Bacilli bacterium]|nr:hypothetical protein [Bacilli bacterium]